jgi:hypothetical protein
MSDRGMEAVRRAGDLARRSGAVNPSHLLAAVLEVSGPLGEMAGVAHAPAPARRSPDDRPAAGGVVHYDRLAHQAIASAGAWAARRGLKAGPEELLIVLVDQHSPSAVAALARMGPDSDRLRQAALRMLGLPDEYGPVALEPLPPAGRDHESLLEIEELPPDIWATLEARQARLPIRRVRHRMDWAAVVVNEQRAALKLARRNNLSHDQTSALLHHHDRAVHRRGAEAVPGIVEPKSRSRSDVRAEPLLSRPSTRLVPEGWMVWLNNRRLGLKVAWFRWTGQRY